MHKRIILLLSLLTSGLMAHAQYTINGRIDGGSGLKVKVGYYRGDKITVFDSAICNPAGEFRIIINENTGPRQMKLITRNHGVADFFFLQSDLNFSTHTQALSDSMAFDGSQPNTTLRAFVRYEQLHQHNMELLTALLDGYSKNTAFYEQVKKESIFRQIDFEATLNKAIIQNEDNLVGKYLLTRRMPRLDPSLDPDGRMELLRDHLLDVIPGGDSSLIYTHAYTRAAIQYLSLYGNPKYDKKTLETAFIEGIKRIMDKFQPYPVVYAHITEYLLDGFQSFGFENVVQFISERFNLEQCDSGNPGLAERIEILKKLAPGLEAPGIAGKDLNGNSVRLSDYRGKYVLIAFWASWCTHCNEIMPKIAEIYNQPGRSGWDVISVAVDTKPSEVKKMVSDNKYLWRTIADGKGWDTKPALDYGIAATPTFIFIGPDGKILSKPATFFEILEELDKNDLLR